MKISCVFPKDKSVQSVLRAGLNRHRFTTFQTGKRISFCTSDHSPVDCAWNVGGGTEIQLLKCRKYQFTHFNFSLLSFLKQSAELENDPQSPRLSPKRGISFSINNSVAKPTVCTQPAAKVTSLVDSVESKKPYGHWIPVRSTRHWFANHHVALYMNFVNGFVHNFFHGHLPNCIV